jgi:tetratricopeptide (TPR) repeat protein
MRGVALVGLSVLLSLSARAECRRAEVDRYAAAAVRLYESLEYERALDSITKAKGVSCGSDDDAMLGMYEGIVRSDLGQAEQARAAFKEALLLKPEAEVPLKVSPKVRKQIEVIRAEAKKELAPILAKQDEERRRKLAEEAKREEQRRDDARRADEARRAEDARRQKQQQAENEKPPSSDSPKQHEIVANPPRENPAVDESLKSEVKQSRGVPVPPIVFGAIGAASAGVAIYFGVSSRGSAQSARDGMWSLDRQKLVDQANSQALIADVLFGVAGAAAVAAVISLVVSLTGNP